MIILSRMYWQILFLFCSILLIISIYSLSIRLTNIMEIHWKICLKNFLKITLYFLPEISFWFLCISVTAFIVKFSDNFFGISCVNSLGILFESSFGNGSANSFKISLGNFSCNSFLLTELDIWILLRVSLWDVHRQFVQKVLSIIPCRCCLQLLLCERIRKLRSGIFQKILWELLRKLPWFLRTIWKNSERSPGWKLGRDFWKNHWRNLRKN